jgi:hypothetical protein
LDEGDESEAGSVNFFGSGARVTFQAPAPYSDSMRRLSMALIIAALALAATGCGTAQHLTAAGQTSRLRGTHALPKWLTRTIGREGTQFHAQLAHGYPGNGQLIRHSNGAVLVTLWGEYTSPTAPSRHGNSLQFVITPRTHRVERVKLIQEINPFAVARRASGYVDLFPSRPGDKACRIPRGGTVLIRPSGGSAAAGPSFAGHCEAEYASATRQSAAAHAVRIRLAERWKMDGRKQDAAWIFTVRYRDGKILDTRVAGQPPQLWK